VTFVRERRGKKIEMCLEVGAVLRSQKVQLSKKKGAKPLGEWGERKHDWGEPKINLKSQEGEKKIVQLGECPCSGLSYERVAAEGMFDCKKDLRTERGGWGGGGVESVPEAVVG